MEDFHTIKQRFQRDLETEVSQPNLVASKPKSAWSGKRRAKRGWNGLEPIHVFRASGVEDKLVWSFIGALAFMFLIIPHNPETDYSLLRDENTHMLLKGLVLAITGFTIYCLVFQNTRIITTSVGFYHCRLWTKNLILWSDSSYFQVGTEIIERESAIIPDKTVEYVYYRHTKTGRREEIRLANFSARVLCSMLNQERDKYLGLAV